MLKIGIRQINLALRSKKKTVNSFKLENTTTPYISFFISKEVLRDLFLTQSILTQVRSLFINTCTKRTIARYGTSDFIKRVRNIREDAKDTILVFMNMKSLYTNILNHEDIEAVKGKLIAPSDKPIATKVIIKSLFQILILNDFLFNSINYLQ